MNTSYAAAGTSRSSSRRTNRSKPRRSEPRSAAIVAEDVGEQGPWDEDLTGDVILVVGAEREGVSQPVLEAADAIVKLPMDGFVPSYNLQVAVSVLAVEALRQRESRGK